MNRSLFFKLAVTAIASVGLAGLTHAKDLQVQDYTLVRVGMSQSEVQQALGQPAHARAFTLSDTASWRYATSEHFERAGDRAFDVDFGADGKVFSAGVVNVYEVSSRH